MCRSVSSAPLVPRLQVEAQADTESVSLLAAHRKHSNAAFVHVRSVGPDKPKNTQEKLSYRQQSVPFKGEVYLKYSVSPVRLSCPVRLSKADG
ncbi:MAG: hypothetical protein BRD42_03790 [Bacteroidetes bacterium QS_3_64_15]|nr:MAG: hypothetical protein BRD42_03790 [Bacteroidetes bacterium QS_3_64_15]